MTDTADKIKRVLDLDRISAALEKQILKMRDELNYMLAEWRTIQDEVKALEKELLDANVTFVDDSGWVQR